MSVTDKPARGQVPTYRSRHSQRCSGMMLSVWLCLFVGGCAGSKSAPELLQAGPAGPRIVETFSDDFTKDKTVKTEWVLSQLNSSSYYKIGSEGLLLEASGEKGGSDLWSGTGYRASLILLPISSKVNWTVITHFTFTPEIDFQAAGIILTTQRDNFDNISELHRFELSYQNRQNGLGVASYTNGPIDPTFAPYNGDEIYLKLEKAGSTYRYSYHAPGRGWKLVSVITDPAPYTYVGLDSIRQPSHGSATLDSKPVFKSFSMKPNRGSL